MEPLYPSRTTPDHFKAGAIIFGMIAIIVLIVAYFRAGVTDTDEMNEMRATVASVQRLANLPNPEDCAKSSKNGDRVSCEYAYGESSVPAATLESSLKANGWVPLQSRGDEQNFCRHGRVLMIKYRDARPNDYSRIRYITVQWPLGKLTEPCR